MTARKFEGRELAGAELVVAGVGVDLDGDHHRNGTKVYLVVEAIVKHVDHVNAKDDADKVLRVERATTLVASVVDRDTVAVLIDAAREAADERAGRLTFELHA